MQSDKEFDSYRVTKLILLAALAVLALMFVMPAATLIFGSAEQSEPVNATQKMMPIYSVDTEHKVVAITFDAAWGADDTDILIEILAEYDVRATFFICGYWMEKYTEDVRKFHKAGHDIANHGDTHAHVAQLDFDKNVAEIMDAHKKAATLFGIEMDLYRPPYGEYNNTVLQAADSAGYYTIQWDVDSLDWKKLGAEHMYNTVINHKNLQNGSILLFHNDLPETPLALRRILDELRKQGYGFVPVSELIYRNDYRQDHTGRQIRK